MIIKGTFKIGEKIALTSDSSGSVWRGEWQAEGTVRVRVLIKHQYEVTSPLGMTVCVLCGNFKLKIIDV